jgi:muconate cycloisomerase
MQITGLELFHISIPFVKPYALSKIYGTPAHAQAVIFKVHTDEGITGLGEADPSNPFTHETPASAMVVTKDVIWPHLSGQDPTRIPLIESILDKAVYGNLTARGAVNMALYDIVGKANRIPVYTLLGGRYRSTLPILGAIGSGTPKEDMAAIEEWIQRSCNTVMIKMGALPIADEIERMRSAKKRYGKQIAFIADINQGWNVTETFEFLEGIGEHRPAMLEQPVARDDLTGLQQIHDTRTCLLSVDESLDSIHNAARVIQKGAADVFSIKVSKNGGLDKSRKIALLAEAFGLKCLMNSMLEFGITQAASLHLGCTLTNLLDMGQAYHSVLRMSDDITDFNQNISNGRVTVPSGSGLGVALDEGKLKKYTQDYLKIV